MSGGFSNPIIGGGGALVYPMIRSPNFNPLNPPASPSPSWAILKNGLAYFVGLVLTGGTITGPDYIINTAGIFIYSGPPATGNLIGSWAGAAGNDGLPGGGNNYPQGFSITQGAITGTTFTGTGFVINAVGAFFYSTTTPALNTLIHSITSGTGQDAAGNWYLPGDTSYGPDTYTGTGYIAFSCFDGYVLSWYKAATMAGVTIPWQNNASVWWDESGLNLQNPGGPVTIEAVGAGNNVIVESAAQIPASSSTPAAVPGAALVYANSGATPSAQTQGGFAGVVPLSQTSVSANTVTATSLTALSNAWPVKANDARNGTVYRLTAAGSATWGATQEVLTLAMAAFGVTVSLPVGATEFTAGLALQWRLQADVVVTNTGAGTANIQIGISAAIGVSGANELTQVNTNQSAGGFSAYGFALTGNTTINSTVTLQATWGAAFGSITCNYSTLERLGA
jgi:hypothetical protein